MDERMEKNNIEKPISRVQKKSEKDKNGMIGGLVLGTIMLVLFYEIYRKFYVFPVRQIIEIVLGIIVFVCYAVAVSCFFDYRESKRIDAIL